MRVSASSCSFPALSLFALPAPPRAPTLDASARGLPPPASSERPTSYARASLSTWPHGTVGDPQSKDLSHGITEADRPNGSGKSRGNQAVSAKCEPKEEICESGGGRGSGSVEGWQWWVARG